MVTRFHLAKLIAAAGAVCIAVSSYAQAGPFGRGGGGQFGGNSGSFGGNAGSGFSGSGSRDRQTQTPDRSSSRDFGQQNNSSDNSSDNSGDSTRTRDRETAGDNADARQPDQPAAAQGADNQSDRGRAASFITRRGDERAVETGDERSKAGERESSEARGEKSEVAKKFESSLLFADVPGANAQQSGPTNNPGLDHMSQQGLQSSEFGRTTAQNAIAQNGPANAPPRHDLGLRRGENDSRDRPRDGHPKLNEQERDMAQQVLKDNFTAGQLETLKETLRSGEITKGEQRNLHNIFSEKLTPQQEKLVVEYLQELMRQQNRQQEKRFGQTNNPGLDHMSQQGLQNSQFGHITAENAIAENRPTNAASRQDVDLRRRENDSGDRPRDGHPKMNEQERDMAQQILTDNFTAGQLETLKETLKSGEITKGEQRNLHNIFSEKLTPDQEKLVVEYLQELMRQQNRQQEKRQH